MPSSIAPISSTVSGPLLSSGDPSAFEVINANAPAPVLLVCDHASNAIPRKLGNLGLSEKDLAKHVALDIGSAELTRRLSRRLNAAAVLCGYSRLVIDCNRQPGDPTSIAEMSDGIVIPGNVGLTDTEAQARLEAVFWPFHHTITTMIAHLWRHGPAPAVVAIHSFTPFFNGLHRPWEIGVLWNHDPRMVTPIMRWLEHHHDLCVGDNEPYSGREVGFTLDHHAGAAGLPHVCLEVRQNLIDDETGCDRSAGILGDALEAVLSNASLHTVEHY